MDMSVSPDTSQTMYFVFDFFCEATQTQAELTQAELKESQPKEAKKKVGNAAVYKAKSVMFVVGRKKKTGNSLLNRLQRALGQRKKKKKGREKKKGERRREWLHFSKNKTNVVCCWQETKKKKRPGSHQCMTTNKNEGIGGSVSSRSDCFPIPSGQKHRGERRVGGGQCKCS